VLLSFRIEECRAVVKRVVKELDLRATLRQGSSYLDSRRQQKALDAGRDAVEYLASVVEFDAFDKFKNVSCSSLLILLQKFCFLCKRAATIAVVAVTISQLHHIAYSHSISSLCPRVTAVTAAYVGLHEHSGNQIYDT
jgi:hypothetical protein